MATAPGQSKAKAVADDAAVGRFRIAIVAPLVTTISEPQQGGSQAILADLAVELTRRGHLVDIYAAAGSVIDGAHLVETGVRSELLSAALIRIGEPRRSLAALDEAYDHVFATVARGEYDVVHSHGFDSAALRRARVGRAPVVHTIHLPPEPEAAEAIREAQAAPEPAVVVGVSAAQERAWRPLVRFDRVIRDGVPVDRIPWTDRPGRGLLFAGRFSADKGASEAIEIARSAGEPIELYGTAYDEDYARAIRLRHEGDPDVTFHEAIPRSELWRRFASARVVLCPTAADESFGLVAAEAQAAGTPVVAFARGALGEVIRDGVTGILVEPGDVRGAAEAVHAAGTIDRRQCRRHAVENLGIDACVSGYVALYAAVAGRRAAQRGARGSR